MTTLFYRYRRSSGSSSSSQCDGSTVLFPSLLCYVCTTTTGTAVTVTATAPTDIHFFCGRGCCYGRGCCCCCGCCFLYCPITTGLFWGCCLLLIWCLCYFIYSYSVVDTKRNFSVPLCVAIAVAAASPSLLRVVCCCRCLSFIFCHCHCLCCLLLLLLLFVHAWASCIIDTGWWMEQKRRVVMVVCCSNAVAVAVSPWVWAWLFVVLLWRLGDTGTFGRSRQSSACRVSKAQDTKHISNNNY